MGSHGCSGLIIILFSSSVCVFIFLLSPYLFRFWCFHLSFGFFFGFFYDPSGLFLSIYPLLILLFFVFSYQVEQTTKSRTTGTQGWRDGSELVCLCIRKEFRRKHFTSSSSSSPYCPILHLLCFHHSCHHLSRQSPVSILLSRFSIRSISQLLQIL